MWQLSRPWSTSEESFKQLQTDRHLLTWLTQLLTLSNVLIQTYIIWEPVTICIIVVWIELWLVDHLLVSNASKITGAKIDIILKCYTSVIAITPHSWESVVILFLILMSIFWCRDDPSFNYVFTIILVNCWSESVCGCVLGGRGLHIFLSPCSCRSVTFLKLVFSNSFLITYLVK